MKDVIKKLSSLCGGAHQDEIIQLPESADKQVSNQTSA